MKADIKYTIQFLILAFGISWIFMFGLVLFAPEIDSPLNLPLSTLAVFGPGIAALIMSLKKMSFKEYLKSTFTFKQRLSCYLVLIIWAVWRYFVCMAIGVRVEGSSLILPLLLIPMCILTGGAEEFGWRFLQPQMEKKMHSVTAVLLFSVIWVAWHLPFWLVPWDWRDSAFDLFQMFGLCMTSAFSFAVIYKLTGSVLLCVLAHAWSNSITNTFMPTGDINTIVGFLIEAIIGMIILILCEKGIIKSVEMKNTKIL